MQGFSVILILLNMISFSHLSISYLRPDFFLMALYYWTVFRPSFLPPYLVFILGILIDVLTGFPIGVHAFIFVLLQWIITSRRLFLTGQTFPIFWLGFTLTSFAAAYFKWAILTFTYKHMLPIGDILISATVGAFLFPLIAVLLINLHKLLPTAMQNTLP